MTRRCLACCGELAAGEKDFHWTCARRFFGTSRVPALPYSRAQLGDLAKQVVRSRTAIAGVQPKLSLALEKAASREPRLTIVGLWGKFILKPQTERFAELPQNEACTMRLAEIAGLKTVPYSLMRFEDGELCYVSRRIDRTARGEKIPMEDFCQILGRVSADKYKSSCERIAEGIARFSAFPGYDAGVFAELLLFSWLTGNSDMHLKNFSLYSPNEEARLAPAYDLLNVALAMPTDKDELALPLRGKRRNLTRNDFRTAFGGFGIAERALRNLFEKFEAVLPRWESAVEASFLSAPARERYREIVAERAARLFG